MRGRFEISTGRRVFYDIPGQGRKGLRISYSHLKDSPTPSVEEKREAITKINQAIQKPPKEGPFPEGVHNGRE